MGQESTYFTSTSCDLFRKSVIPTLRNSSKNNVYSGLFLSIMLLCTPLLVAQSCSTLCDPMDCSLSGSSSMGFSRQEYWNGLPCPPPGDLPNPGIKPVSLTSPTLAGGFFAAGANDKPRQHIKKQSHRFADVGPYSQIHGFSSSHVQM